jgi:hypothetical protein
MTMRYYLTPVRMAMIQKKKGLEKKDTGEDMKKREHLHTVLGKDY